MSTRLHFFLQNSSRFAFLKFIYSEKATNFCEISTVDLSYVVMVKSTVEISQNFVAFLEYMNFILRILVRYSGMKIENNYRFFFLSGMWNQLFREGHVIKQMQRHLASKSVMILILIIQTLKCCPQLLMETVQTRKNKPPLLTRENRLFEYKKYTLIQTLAKFLIYHA